VTTPAPDRTWSADGGEGYGAESYGDTFADVYDEWYADVSEVDTTVDRITALAAGGRTLELGVGTGRIALPLAARGVPVSGIDASARMVERLRAKAGADRVDVTVGDMAVDLPAGPFAVVFVAYNTLFNLLHKDAQARCIVLVASRLSRHGAFVVEGFVPDEPRPAGTRIDVRSLADDQVVLNVSRHEPDAQRVDGQFVELTESGVRLRPWAIRYSSPAELDEMALSAGLELEHRWADWSETPFTRDSPYHVSVYRLVVDPRA